jgi:predicted dehydrogenase
MSPRSKFKKKNLALIHNLRSRSQSFRLSVTRKRWQTPAVMTSKVRVAVLGVGSLGKEHARIYSELAAAGQVEFTGVYDISTETARKFAQKYQVRAFASPAEAAGAADALNIVTPTTTHYDMTKPLLAQGKHVLLEKPMTDSSAQAAELVQLALQKNCILQVGHVERFNPIFKYL